MPARGGGNRAWRRPATSADHAARVPRAFVQYCNASARGMTLRTHLASTEAIHRRASPQPCGAQRPNGGDGIVCCRGESVAASTAREPPSEGWRSL